MNTKQTFALLLAAVILTLSACTGGIGSQSADLNGTSWTLTRLNSQPVVEGTAPGLRFAEGQVSGSGSCNGFGGEYTQSGDKLTFGPLMSTLMACMPQEIMEQESAYFAALSATASFHVDGGILSLLGADGNVLAEFVAVAP
jgi:heat shock protein HslJ